MIGIGRRHGDPGAIDREEPQLVVAGRGDGLAAAGRLVDHPAHVRLAAADPNVADQDVLPLDFVSPWVMESVAGLAACREGCELDLPLAIGRLGRDFLAGETDGDFFRPVGGSPNRQLCVALSTAPSVNSMFGVTSAVASRTSPQTAVASRSAQTGRWSMVLFLERRLSSGSQCRSKAYWWRRRSSTAEAADERSGENPKQLTEPGDYLLLSVVAGKLSVRNGLAGRPSLFHRLTTG